MVYVCYCVLCVCDFVLMFKFEFVFFVFGFRFVLGSRFTLWNQTREAFITQNQAVQELAVCNL